jgi:hypothetical protein
MRLQNAKCHVELKVDGRGRYTMLGLETGQASWVEQCYVHSYE